MIIEGERHLHELKCWELTLQIYALATQLEGDSGHSRFLKKSEFFSKQSGENDREAISDNRKEDSQF